MILLLNKDNVIIDIVENLRYVRKNKNGYTVLCHEDEDPQGLIGSDDTTIYALAGTQLQTAYTDIVRSVMPAELAEETEPLKYKWNDETGDVEPNEDAYPLDNTFLTKQAGQNAADIEYIAMVSDIDL